ncbi:MAG: FGGY-family carbohydrate kinase [Oscillospiraceae bacterium]|nr:FGGY-family carbohydrate kinase [Oscillospiraceae bacterium]MBP5239381.1 FGGY-family carbohydrate kinase [Oscillospiraceae bacterium]
MIDLTKTALGIELGSTRIKAVLIDDRHLPIASGDYEWENQLVNGIWTYSMDIVHTGVQTCFASLNADVKAKFGVDLTTVGAIGVSAMMHGYLPFDKDGRQLAEFRTWRNTITGEAAEKLTALFGFNIPQRWSIAHLYQAILNGEEHVKELAFLTTLAGYIHWRLTGEKVMGVGEASGMFPIDSEKLDYDEGMVQKFRELTGVDLRAILPRVLPAGENAGTLTKEGALFLDPMGILQPGIPVAPCEGDAGTGMVATNSVRVRTGNVSAGTSDFAMIVTDQSLGVHREIDMVTTPDGLPVAMVHCNNCTSDINAWVGIFSEFSEMMGFPTFKGELFTRLFYKALEGDSDCGGLLSYNYFSGEGVTDLDEGRPLFARTPNARFTLANFMRTHLLSALATLKIGLDILTQNEKVAIDKLYGHGGFFKTPEVGQKMLSAAVGAPVSVMETAGEGGPYGMALLAAYMLWKQDGESLPDYLDGKVFADAKSTTLMADKKDVAGFNAFLTSYKKALPIEKAATELL